MRLDYDPGRLIDADLELILEERLPGDASKGHLPRRQSCLTPHVRVGGRSVHRHGGDSTRVQRLARSSSDQV